MSIATASSRQVACATINELNQLKESTQNDARQGNERKRLAKEGIMKVLREWNAKLIKMSNAKYGTSNL